MKWPDHQLSTTLVVSLFEILVSFEVKLSQLNFSLSIFDKCVLQTKLALLDVPHNPAQQPLEHLPHSLGFLNRNLIILTLLRFLKRLNFTC